MIVFNIVRCCVFRSLCLHRNKRLYNTGTSTNAVFVWHDSFAYVDLHLRKIRSTASTRIDVACCSSYRDLRLAFCVTLPPLFSIPFKTFDFTMARHFRLQFNLAFGSWIRYYVFYGAKAIGFVSGHICWPRIYYEALGLKLVRRVKAAPF